MAIGARSAQELELKRVLYRESPEINQENQQQISGLNESRGNFSET
jgi:hypothetical protein